MKILITYQYFLPAFKAGGPVQSINNMARQLASDAIKIYILCSDKDLDNSELSVPKNKWVIHSDNICVFYKTSSSSNSLILKVVDELRPDKIFINGLYSFPFTLLPLYYNGSSKKILSVRGMLHPGALSQKKLKKRIFLSVFKALGLHKKCEYHCTTEEEAGYVKDILGDDKSIWTISNLPNVLTYQKPLHKSVGEVKLISVSLISPMKNILLVLQSLKKVKSKVSYYIYGPVKDPDYWSECEKEIQRLPQNIHAEYKGEVTPDDVKTVLSNAHFFILPSKSENFGHAIYEALSAGKPVITSNNTPWNGLDIANAGANVDPENIEQLSSAIESIGDVGNEEYITMSVNARTYIENQYDLTNIKEQYIEMLSS